MVEGGFVRTLEGLSLTHHGSFGARGSGAEVNSANVLTHQNRRCIALRVRIKFIHRFYRSRTMYSRCGKGYRLVSGAVGGGGYVRSF